MVDENFYKEFKEVYQAVNIIGREVMSLKKRIEVIDNNINEIKQKLSSQRVVEEKPRTASQKSDTDDPARKASYEKYVRARTGDFKPGDKEVDVGNVFYTGSRKRV